MFLRKKNLSQRTVFHVCWPLLEIQRVYLSGNNQYSVKLWAPGWKHYTTRVRLGTSSKKFSLSLNGCYNSPFFNNIFHRPDCFICFILISFKQRQKVTDNPKLTIGTRPLVLIKKFLRFCLGHHRSLRLHTPVFYSFGKNIMLLVSRFP